MAVSHFLMARGYTFIELLVVSAIVMILASAVMPLAKVAATRQREAELRHALREIRTAIDKYKDAADTMQIGPLEIKVGSEGYPPDLETLVEGVAANNDATGRKLKFLRKVPVDPMTHSMDWGLRSYQDKPDSSQVGRPERVRRLYDVRRHGARRHEVQGLVIREQPATGVMTSWVTE